MAAFGQLYNLALAPGSPQTQGGPITDPRWTNGTWGGTSDPNAMTDPNGSFIGAGKSGGSWFDQNGFGDPTAGITNAQQAADYTRNYAANPPSLPQAPAASGPQNGDYQSWFMQLTQGKPPTPDTLNSLAPQLQQYGITLVRNAAGVPGKIKLPDGSIVDVIQGAGVGGQAWQWLGPGSGGGSSAGGMGGFGSGGFGSGTFTAPTLEQAQNSPGYQFALQQGEKAIQNSAAARGTLLTGGTLKALENFGVGLGDNTYGEAFNRALQTHQTNVGDLYNLASLGRPQ